MLTMHHGIPALRQAVEDVLADASLPQANLLGGSEGFEAMEDGACVWMAFSGDYDEEGGVGRGPRGGAAPAAHVRTTKQSASCSCPAR